MNEHVVINQSKTNVVFEADEAKSMIGIDDFESTANDESQDSEDSGPSRENLKTSWFKKLPDKAKKISFKANISLSAAREPKKGIISWFYDNDLSLFVIKRYDGIQYLKNNLKTFSSMPKCEIKELAWKELINRSNNPYAEVLARIIRREGRSNKFELLKPSVGKRVADESRIDPRTNRPWMRMYYKPVKCLKTIPLKKMPLDILDNLKWWYVDCETGEAVMEDSNEKILLQIYDCLHLVNLSKNDLLKLHMNKILYTERWEFEGQRYQKIVKVCIDKGLHAGSKLNDE